MSDDRIRELRKQVRRWLTNGRADHDVAHTGDELDALRGDIEALQGELCTWQREQLETHRRADEILHVLLGIGEVNFARRASLGDGNGSLDAIAASVNMLAEELEANHEALATRTEEIERAKQAAEEATRAKSEFLANMSHEIRTPLTAVLGFADLLFDTSLSESERLDYVQTIRRNGEHLLLLINDVLDLSKIEAGRVAVERIACSPHRILNDIESMMRVRALDKGLVFTLRYDSPIPETIESDPTRLRQVLVNLVSNAIKFTDRGHVQLNARCEGVGTPESRLMIEIVDTGIGISDDQQAYLFKPFAQANPSTTRRFGGTGLGLAICAPLAAELGGVITIDSTPGAGSRFTLTLRQPIAADAPLIRQPSDYQQSNEPQSAVSAPTSMWGSILLAEDGVDNQILIKTILQKRGLEVTVAENGQLAVEEATRALHAGRPYDVILMDMQMPELDGYGATGKLRARGYSGTIIALTAHALGGERERCLAAGCDDYMSKPVDRTRLLALVGLYLHRLRGGAATHVSGATTGARGASPPAASEPSLYSAYANDSEMAELITGFIGRLPAQIDDIRAAAEGGDAETVRRLAHQLKGAGGSYGFPPVTAVAAGLERAAGTGDAEAYRAQIDELAAVCDRVRDGQA